MSADDLRRAAALMRAGEGWPLDVDEFALAVADLLEESARTVDNFGTIGQRGSLNYCAVAVARAYLGVSA